ncbi:hypothetical protein WP39_19850 [Streptomyces sp. 604F]|nr:hypothetical protein [Streptomyces sp. 604F]
MQPRRPRRLRPGRELGRRLLGTAGSSSFRRKANRAARHNTRSASRFASGPPTVWKITKAGAAAPVAVWCSITSSTAAAQSVVPLWPYRSWSSWTRPSQESRLTSVAGWAPVSKRTTGTVPSSSGCAARARASSARCCK